MVTFLLIRISDVIVVPVTEFVKSPMIEILPPSATVFLAFSIVANGFSFVPSPLVSFPVALTKTSVGDEPDSSASLSVATAGTAARTTNATARTASAARSLREACSAPPPGEFFRCFHLTLPPAVSRQARTVPPIEDSLRAGRSIVLWYKQRRPRSSDLAPFGARASYRDSRDRTRSKIL